MIGEGRQLEDFNEDVDNKLEKKNRKKTKNLDKFNKIQENFRDTDTNNVKNILI